MQIIELELSHYNFFCPVTGEYIIKEGEPVNDEAVSLMGYWINEVIDEPFIKNAALKKGYDMFLLSEKEENKDFYFNYEELEKFLSTLGAQNWVTYKITTKTMSCNNGPIWETVYFVIDMDTYTE